MKRTLSLTIKAVALLGLLTVCATCEPAFAATFTVTNIHDSGPGSLRQAIQALINNVESLVAQGVLNPGQGNALTSKLRAAMKQLERGNIQAGVNQINAFINQVAALIRSRRLTPQQGQPLIDAATSILEQIAP